MISCLDFDATNCGELFEVVIYNRKMISDIRILELVLDKEDNVYEQVIGCYVFMNDNAVEYVGKCSSRCFVERIPSHFDPRERGWFNNYIKLVAREIYGDSSDPNIHKALVLTKKKYLSIMPVSAINYNIAMVEKIFRHILKPKYNALSGRQSTALGKVIDSNMSLSEAIRRA